jgi:hypothetical protein
MRNPLLFLIPMFVCVLPPAAAQSGAIEHDESLNFAVNWPSGLSLGEGFLRARRLPEREGVNEYSLVLDAAIPGITVRDEYMSRATAEFCSLEFEKQFEHGKRKGGEKSVFDQTRGVVVRTTANGGGKSEVPAVPCAKDALTFLQFLRKEVAQGRLPAAQPIHFGATYQVRVAFGGAQHLVLGGERVEADKLNLTVKGPASEHAFEVWLARDEVRTPVRIRVPFALGVFSMDLVR